MDKLVIVISGQIVRENSSNLLNFWRGFINIQNAIDPVENLKIVAHSWNPEFDGLVKAVYDVNVLVSETQPSFIKEYMPLLNPVNKFEKGLRRSKSIWKKVSYQAILGNARSRATAISMLKNLRINEDSPILACRWDQGCTGSKNVNSIIFDKSLSTQYIYLSYYSEIDEGYADMWFIAPLKLAMKFAVYDRYILTCLEGENNYFRDFTENGWYLAIKKNNQKIKINELKKKVISKVLRLTKGWVNQILPTFLLNKLIGLQSRLENLINEPDFTGENSLLFTSKTDVTFPNYQALNNHAMLKSFIIENDLREKTRFLDINDFQNVSKGQMLNPIDFCYVIYSHSTFFDCWEMAVKQAKVNLPKNCKKIFLVSEKSEISKENFARLNQENVELLTYDERSKYTDRLIEVFLSISPHFDSIYFVHEDMPLIGEVDKIYLNTLFHYLNNSNEFYVKLVDTTYVDNKELHDSFPDLVKNMGGYTMSVQPSLLKPSYLISFLENFHQDIYGFEQLCTNSNLTFSAVEGRKKIGKYLLVNEKFPHIATAISKGKWCTSEWGDEINFLAKQYGFDLSIRGEC